VRCVGVLRRVEPSHPWASTWVDGAGHENNDDGVAPLAVFELRQPERYAGREVGVLFKHAGPTLAAPPTAAAVGTRFAFELPGDFFIGTHNSIDNVDVRAFGD